MENRFGKGFKDQPTQQTNSYEIYYGRYGNKRKIVKAKSSSEVLKKYSKLELHQITKLKDKIKPTKVYGKGRHQTHFFKERDLARALGHRGVKAGSMGYYGMFFKGKIRKALKG